MEAINHTGQLSAEQEVGLTIFPEVQFETFITIVTFLCDKLLNLEVLSSLCVKSCANHI
jgi:hypothetical protein